MAFSNIKAVLQSDIQTVWNVVTSVEGYTWRSDLSKTEILSEKQFVEYTTDGYATFFTITAAEPYKRWEFDMDNENMKVHWTGIFTQKGEQTEIDFSEEIIPKKVFMKPFIKSYMKKQQTKFIEDLKKVL
ncbi:MAG: SRPBCC family protein [Lachnospiraceae bacterium]|nr:SRPBCC family protein [Lachnospiraceae bacterium]